LVFGLKAAISEERKRAASLNSLDGFGSLEKILFFGALAMILFVPREITFGTGFVVSASTEFGKASKNAGNKTWKIRLFFYERTHEYSSPDPRFLPGSFAPLIR